MSAKNETPPCGFRSLVLLVIASMVGAGVFTTSGFTLAAVGSPALVIVCWVVGAFIAICGAIAYGRLAEIIPESGGEFLYLSRFVHPFAGFLAGWVSLTAGFSGAIALAALTFEQYAIPEGWRPDWLPADAVAIAVIIVCGYLHGTLIRAGIRLQNTVVVVQLTALLTFLAVTVRTAATQSWHTAPLPDFNASGLSLLNAMAVSVVWISLSYAGFNAAIYVASESDDARRNVPKSLLTGTILVAVFYLLLNTVFVTAAPAKQLAGQADVAAVAAQVRGGAALESIVRVGIVMSLLSSVSGMILTGPRVYQKMADDGVFPSWFSGPQSVRRSVSLQCIFACGLILAYRMAVRMNWAENSLSQLLTFLGSTLSLSAAGCVATLFLPSVRARSGKASLFSLLAAGVFVAATLAAIVLMVCSGDDLLSHARRHLTGTAIVMLSGTIAWRVFRR